VRDPQRSARAAEPGLRHAVSAADEHWVKRLRVSPDDLARIEREVERRVAGVKLPDPEARAPACESCGGATVRWGGLCNECRRRLREAQRPGDR
jgi:hypothetical protein